MSHAILKDSSKVDQPVEKILSQENRRTKLVWHAIERGYKVYLSVIEGSVTLSPSEKDKMLQEARDSCPWLNLIVSGPWSPWESLWQGAAILVQQRWDTTFCFSSSRMHSRMKQIFVFLTTNWVPTQG
jgi:hypothetical protein